MLDIIDEELSDEELSYLDENTIDEFFLPRIYDDFGNKIDAETAAYDSPFSNQEDSGEYFPDAWKPVNLAKGTELYQIGRGEDDKTCFYTDSETVEFCRDLDTGEVDIDKLKSLLQISDEAGEKTTLTKFYTMADDIRAVSGTAIENMDFGIGGGNQYFIPQGNEFKSSGLIMSELDMLNKNDKS